MCDPSSASFPFDHYPVSNHRWWSVQGKNAHKNFVRLNLLIFFFCFLHIGPFNHSQPSILSTILTLSIRGGDFCYDDDEFDAMLEDIKVTYALVCLPTGATLHTNPNYTITNSKRTLFSLKFDLAVPHAESWGRRLRCFASRWISGQSSHCKVPRSSDPFFFVSLRMTAIKTFHYANHTCWYFHVDLWKLPSLC